MIRIGKDFAHAGGLFGTSCLNAPRTPTEARGGAARFLLVAGLVAGAFAPACRKTDRLPPRPEEDESAAIATVAQVDAAVAAPPAGLSAPGRTEAERVDLTVEGVRVVGDFFAGAGGAVFPAIVLVHGERGSRVDWQPLVNRILLTPRAVPSVLAIDLRGHGESTAAIVGGTVEAKRLQDAPYEGPASWGATVADVGAALGWLRTRAAGEQGSERPSGGSVVDRRVVVVASGIGVAAAIRAAAIDAAEKAGEYAVPVAGVVGLSPVEAHGVAFGEGSVERLVERGARFWVVAAEDDSAAAPAGVRAIEAAAGVPNARAEVLETGGHGADLLRERPEVADGVLAFVARLLFPAPRQLRIPVGDELALAGEIEPALDPSGCLVLMVHDLRRTRRSMDVVRDALRDVLPCRIAAFDLRGHGESGADAAGNPVGFDEFFDDIPAGDLRSYAGFVRDVEAAIRHLVSPATVPGGSAGPWAIVGVGFGATVAAVAAADLAAGSGIPAPAALVLVSPIANAHGFSIWSSLGERLKPRGVPVLAVASSRASMSLQDMADGIGTDARTVGVIASMLGDGARTRVFASDAHGERIFSMHPEAIPLIVEFLAPHLRRSTAAP